MCGGMTLADVLTRGVSRQDIAGIVAEGLADPIKLVREVMSFAFGYYIGWNVALIESEMRDFRLIESRFAKIAVDGRVSSSYQGDCMDMLLDELASCPGHNLLYAELCHVGSSIWLLQHPSLRTAARALENALRGRLMAAALDSFQCCESAKGIASAFLAARRRPPPSD